MSPPGSDALPLEETIDERRELFTGEANKRRRSYPARCRMCKQPMEPLRQMDGQLTLQILPYVIGVIAWLSGKTDGPPLKVLMMVPEHFSQFVADELRAEKRREIMPITPPDAATSEHPPP